MFKDLRFSLFVLVLLVLSGNMGLAGQPNRLVKQIEQAFEAFEYRTVIQLSDSLLAHPGAVDTTQMIEILRMKAIAHYTLNEEDRAALAFYRILQLNQTYTLDPLLNSPKIIAFFRGVKKDILKNPSVSSQKEVTKPEPPTSLRFSTLRQALWRSMLLPGWGHLHQKRSKKGVVLAGLSGVTISAAIYYLVKTHQLEKHYLNSIEQKEIDAHYRQYNQAFKIRNALLIGYALLWSYAQIDLLQQVELNMRLLVMPAAEFSPTYQVRWHWPF